MCTHVSLCPLAHTPVKNISNENKLYPKSTFKPAKYSAKRKQDFLTLTAILLEFSSLITANSWQTPGGVRWFPPKAEKSYRVILTLWVGSTSITQGWYDVPQPVSAVTALDRYPLGPGTWIAYEAWHCCLLADTTTRKRNVFVLISFFKNTGFFEDYFKIISRLFQEVNFVQSW